MKNKTTAKHFEIFKVECQKWIEIFGLKGWRFHYDHKKLDNAWARAIFNMNGRNATLQLNIEWGESVDIRDIKMSAFHEVCEVLFCRLKLIGESRYIQEDELQEEVHNLIRTFENVLWEKD